MTFLLNLTHTTRAACHRYFFRSLQSPDRAAIYRVPSAKRSPSCVFKDMESARLPASLGGPPRRSRASCAGMPRHLAGHWNIGPPPRNGMLIVRRAVPKPAKLVGNKALYRYVPDRLAGAVTAPDGVKITGPKVTWKGRRSGRRQHRQWAMAWSPEQIARRLPFDFPADDSMRISHEAIYQALYVQGRGALRRELTACLRTGRALRMPRA